MMSMVTTLKLKELVSLPFSNPLSSGFKHELDKVVNMVYCTTCFVKVTFTPSVKITCTFTVMNNVTGSFLSAYMDPAYVRVCMGGPSMTGLFAGFSVYVDRFLLPFLVKFMTTTGVSCEAVFVITNTTVFVSKVLVLFLPFPREGATNAMGGRGTGLGVAPTTLTTVLVKFADSSAFVL